ncbi:zinc finger protein 687a isoform X2 [Carassius auratus]|uniref:Zinc finger protein 687a isoform X2 n=1 Tax=Carassius auratus TaxID=7957 RepID=A0A6P6R4K4_CARAU|nr:zinc finger protein 687a-like isoform X2 [Carassius auratus]
MGMGDMKTPDFDDLLAAFDIPDIDAKEAIQSDTDGNQNERSGVVGKERSGSPCLRPPESPEPVPLAPQNDPSVVSVIVKNSVHSDDKTEGNVTEGDISGADASHESPQQGPSEDSLVPPDPFIINRLKTVSVGATEPSTPPSLIRMQPNGQLWSLSAPSVSTDDNQDGTSSKHPSSTFSKAQSLPLPDPPILSSHLISSDFPARVDCEEAPPLNGALRAGVRRHLSEDEESEPDLGSPALVIQESPDSQRCSAPKVPRLKRSPSSMFQPPSPSSPSLPVSNTQIEEPSVQNPTLLQSGVNPTSLTSTSDLPAEEKDVEHIIEERDSPESPEPEIPQPRLSNQQEANEPEQKVRKEGAAQNQVIDMSISVQENSGLQLKTEAGGGVETRGKSTKTSLVESPSGDVTNSGKTSSKPLKVRIKTVKTSAGNISRTVSKVAPKGGTSKGLGGSKVQAGAHRIQKSGDAPQRRAQGSKLSMLPVSTLQDASTAMLFAASKAQNQMATSLSTTAVKITRTSTLPSITSSPMPGVRSLGQKTMNGNPGTAKPASIVNNSGAVISRSQSSLVEAFNKILNSKNPLPSYHPDLSIPPPPEWGLRVPSTGYRCLECGDAFALERSLARHYDRRSMRIEVTCNHCSKRLAFFNKCSLLLHAREHKEKGLVMQCSHLIMSPVSVEQMIGQQDTVPIGVLSPAASTLSAIKESGVHLSQSSDNSCPECWSPFKGKAEIMAHFQEVEPGGTETCCMQCSPPMPLWNSCSAAAHRRLHQQLPPLVCPECGVTCQSHELITHLNQTCLHYSRRLGYRCACCHLVFGGANSLNAVKTHMQTAHCEVFHKCPSCPMAFKSSSSAEGHCVSQHPELPETERQSKEIYKCVMCRTVFTQKALLSVHIDTHLAKQKMHVFKCPDCNKLFTQRGSLLEHVKDSHRDSSVYDTSAQNNLVKMESSDGEQEGQDEDEDRGRGAREDGNSAVQRWSCSQCQTHYTDKENYITHMSEQHGKELKKFPCTLCEGSFSSSSSLRRHIRVKHKGIKRAFYCQLCKGGKRSFSTQHGGDRGAATKSQSQAVPGITDAADSSSEHDGGPGTLGGASVEAESQLAESSLTRPGRGTAAEEQEATGFRCMPCGFTTEHREEFLQHIVCHRDGGSSFQCQQCGACFASSSSLSRHLFISHRVRDSPSERKHASPVTGSNSVTSDSAVAAGSPGSPSSVGGAQAEDGEGKHTCKVCGRYFSKPADLNTHFRTHGMAFITAYKTDKPA